MLDRLPTEELAELMTGKETLLDQLRRLARHQGDLIAAGDHARLMSVLAAKDTLLRRLLDLEQRLDPYRAEDPDKRVWRSDEARRQCRRVAERCDSLLSELMLLEKQGETELGLRCDEAARRLDGMRLATDARRAYREHSEPAARAARCEWES
ncbi:MAG: hypothetical protein FJ297_03100 [Planctomycetes bacterium]|nr:hypothetical protein [Planctomycetota bacterium]